MWDEPEGGSTLIPFFAIGPHVKSGYTSTVAYTHSSLVKTVEEIFGLPILPTVAERQRLRRSVPARHASVGAAQRGELRSDWRGPRGDVSRRRLDGQRVGHRRIVAAHDARDVGAAGIGVADDLRPVRDE